MTTPALLQAKPETPTQRALFRLYAAGLLAAKTLTPHVRGGINLNVQTRVDRAAFRAYAAGRGFTRYFRAKARRVVDEAESALARLLDPIFQYGIVRALGPEFCSVGMAVSTGLGIYDLDIQAPDYTGVADATTAWQNGITAAEALRVGATLWVRSGQFKITAQLTLTADRALVIHGENVASSNETGVRLICTTAVGAVFYITGTTPATSNAHLAHNNRFEQIAVSCTAVVTYAFYLRNVDTVKFHEVRTHGAQYAIYAPWSGPETGGVPDTVPGAVAPGGITIRGGLISATVTTVFIDHGTQCTIYGGARFAGTPTQYHIHLRACTKVTVIGNEFNTCGVAAFYLDDNTNNKCAANVFAWNKVILGAGQVEKITSFVNAASIDNVFPNLVDDNANPGGYGTIGNNEPPLPYVPLASKGITADYTMRDGDHTIRVSAAAGPVTVTLKNPANRNGLPVVVIKTDATSNAVTIATEAGTINDAATFTLAAQYHAAVLEAASSSTTWRVVADYRPAGAANGFATLDSNARLPASQTPTTPTADTIAERTAGAGVTVDGVKAKDGYLVPSATAGESGAIGVAGGDAYVHDGTAARKLQDTNDKGVGNGIASLDVNAVVEQPIKAIRRDVSEASLAVGEITLGSTEDSTRPSAKRTDGTVVRLERTSAKGSASGYCDLDADTEVPASRLGKALKAGGAYSDQSALGFNAARRPSTTRPTLVIASGHIQCDKGQQGRVRALVDSANPPTTVRADGLAASTTTDGVNTQTIATPFCLVFIVPANEYYQVATVNVAGAPTFTLSTLQEVPL